MKTELKQVLSVYNTIYVVEVANHSVKNIILTLMTTLDSSNEADPPTILSFIGTWDEHVGEANLQLQIS